MYGRNLDVDCMRVNSSSRRGDPSVLHPVVLLHLASKQSCLCVIFNAANCACCRVRQTIRRGCLQMVLCCLLNRGDSLLCDEYTYSHLVEAMVGPKGYQAVPVPMDEYGMTPESLEQVKCPKSTCCHT